MNSPRITTALFASALAMGALAPRSASASPDDESEDSKAAAPHFAEGLRLYSVKDYLGASRELQAAYQLDPDGKTLFAWGQAERFSGHCKRSREILTRYIAEGANENQTRAAYKVMADCKSAGSTEAPVAFTRKAGAPMSGPGTDGSEATTTGETTETSVNDAGAARVGTPGHAHSEEGTTMVGPSAAVDGSAEGSVDVRAGSKTSARWYSDPVALSLLVGGGALVLIGAGAYANALVVEDDAQAPGVEYDRYVELQGQAESSRTTALIAGVAGGVALGAALVYVFSLEDASRPALSAQLSRGTVGISFGGDF